MNFRHIIYPIIIVLSMLLSSCESAVSNVDIPKVDPKLVVQCFISPQDTFYKAYLSLSNPIYNQSGQGVDVTNADVKISDGVSTVSLVYNSLDNYYSAPVSSLPIVAGKTYSIRVTLLDGKHAESECTVPAMPDPASVVVKIDSVKSNRNSTDIVTYITDIQWNDIAGQTNYYLPQAYIRVMYGGQPTYYTMYNQYDDNEMVTDKDKDGQALSYNGLTYEYQKDTWSGNIQYADSIGIALSGVDVNYYKFKKSLANFHGDDPFSEPSLIYSNMRNGLGVFAACNSYFAAFKLK